MSSLMKHESEDGQEGGVRQMRRRHKSDSLRDPDPKPRINQAAQSSQESSWLNWRQQTKLISPDWASIWPAGQQDERWRQNPVTSRRIQAGFLIPPKLI